MIYSVNAACWPLQYSSGTNHPSKSGSISLVTTTAFFSEQNPQVPEFSEAMRAYEFANSHQLKISFFQCENFKRKLVWYRFLVHIGTKERASNG